MMQSVAKFGTSAYRVSGSCDDLLQLLPDTLHVQGRIAHEQVWDYLLQLKSSTSRVWIGEFEFSLTDYCKFLTMEVWRTWRNIKAIFKLAKDAKPNWQEADWLDILKIMLDEVNSGKLSLKFVFDISHQSVYMKHSRNWYITF